MKRFLVVVFSIALLLAAAGCERRDKPRQEESSGSSATEPETDPTEPETQPTEPETEPTKEEEEEPDTEGVEQAARDVMAALQSGDRERIRGVIDYTNLFQLETNQTDQNQLAILRHLEYEITDIEMGKSTASVTMKITNADMTTMLSDYNQKCMELEYNNALSSSPLEPEALEASYERLFDEMLAGAATAEHTVDLKFIQSDGGWRAQVSEPLRIAVFGDFFAARRQAGQNAGGGVR